MKNGSTMIILNVKNHISPGQSLMSIPKRDIHESKVLLRIWWDMWKGVVYYELLNQIAAKHSTTINQFESYLKSEISNNASKKM